MAVIKSPLPDDIRKAAGEALRGQSSTSSTWTWSASRCTGLSSARGSAAFT